MSAPPSFSGAAASPEPRSLEGSLSSLAGGTRCEQLQAKTLEHSCPLCSHVSCPCEPPITGRQGSQAASVLAQRSPNMRPETELGKGWSPVLSYPKRSHSITSATSDSPVYPHSSLNACVCSVVSDSLQSHGQQPARLLGPYDFPGKNIGLGHRFPIQGMWLAPSIVTWRKAA